MSDRNLVQELLARAAFAHDDDDARGLADCFTPDGLLEVWMIGDRRAATTTRGRDDISAHTETSLSRKGSPRRHVLSTSRIEKSERDGAGVVHWVRTYLQVWELPANQVARLVSTGTYRDEVLVTGGEALLRRRGVELDSSPFPSS